MTVPETLTGLKTNNATRHLDLEVQGVLREIFFTLKKILKVHKQTNQSPGRSFQTFSVIWKADCSKTSMNAENF